MSRWNNPESRRREALRAAHAQDADVLTDLVWHHLRLTSRRAGVVSPQTMRAYALATRDFLTFVGPPDAPRHALSTLDADVVTAYVAALHARGVTVSTVRTYLYGVRALFRALVWAGGRRDDPARDVRPPIDPTPAHTRKRALGAAQVRTLLAAPRELHGDEGEVGARDHAILMLGATLGLRAAELVALDVRDVNLAMSEVFVRHGKGGKARRVPVTRGVAEVLTRWLRAREGLRLRGAVREDEAALLVSLSPGSYGRRLSTRGLRSVVNRYLAHVGLPSDMFGVHTLRRTAGTRLYRATKDLHVVADLLGHANISTSAIYAKLDADARREALERMEEQEA